MLSFVHEGKTLTVTAPRTVTSDAGVQIGEIFGIASYSCASGASLELEVVGVFDSAKDTSTFNEGDAVYWDNVAFLMTSNSGGASGANLHIGCAELVQASGTNAPGGLTGDATVRVKLNNSASLTGMKIARAQYNFTTDGGVVGLITPAVNVTIPINAVIVGSVINSTTAVTSAGALTITVGTSAGSSATSILGSTGKASLTLNALIAGAAQFATPVKMSAPGNITVTIGTAAATAGVVEVEVAYYVSGS